MPSDQVPLSRSTEGGPFAYPQCLLLGCIQDWRQRRRVIEYDQESPVRVVFITSPNNFPPPHCYGEEGVVDRWAL